MFMLKICFSRDDSINHFHVDFSQHKISVGAGGLGFFIIVRGYVMFAIDTMLKFVCRNYGGGLFLFSLIFHHRTSPRFPGHPMSQQMSCCWLKRALSLLTQWGRHIQPSVNCCCHTLWTKYISNHFNCLKSIIHWRGGWKCSGDPSSSPQPHWAIITKWP